MDLLSVSSDKNYNEIDGKSLVPVIEGIDERPRIAFSQSGNPLSSGKPPKEPNVYSVRTDEWKYIKNIHDNTEELYDLKQDPTEKTNLAHVNTKKINEMSDLMNEILNS